MMDIYIYGSICRGEIDSHSDIDVLCIVDEETDNIKQKLPKHFSIYSKKRIIEHFELGTLFAWHLHKDAVLINSETKGFLSELGKPKEYDNIKNDLDVLLHIFYTSVQNIRKRKSNIIYELGLAYVAIRNIATIASWYDKSGFNCSRYVPYNLNSPKFPIDRELYEVFVNCRHATTRGRKIQNELLIEKAIESLDHIDKWIKVIINTIYKNEK